MNSAAGYDLANATLDALKNMNGPKKNLTFKGSLASLNFDGTLGRLKFGADGEPLKPVHFYTIRDMKVIFQDTLN